MKDYKDWCGENNFDVNNFGPDPAILPASKTRCDAVLCMHHAAARNKILCFGQLTELRNNNDEVFFLLRRIMGKHMLFKSIQ